MKLDPNKAYKDEVTGSIISNRSEYEKYKARMKDVNEIIKLKKEVSSLKEEIFNIKKILEVQ